MSQEATRLKKGGLGERPGAFLSRGSRGRAQGGYRRVGNIQAKNRLAIIQGASV